MTVLVSLSCASTKGSGRSRAAGRGGGGESPPSAPIATGTLGTLTAAKWRLENGLEIITLPDPGATSVAYTTWFRVGSRNEDEPAGETGLAHLFEHLMFGKIRGRSEGAFDRLMEAAGANTNAMTYYDFTAYLDQLPPGRLELAIELESDRMLNLELGDRAVATERDVVVEERLSTVEDSVDGTLDELMYRQAFKRHPYRWPVIGWMKDIKAVTPAKAEAFYRRFYAPNNAIVVVAGQFSEKDLVAAIARRYGGLPPSSGLPEDRAKPERAPAAEVRSTVTRPVPADRLAIGYPAPALGHRDRAAFELVAELLAGGPSSRLQRLLVVDREIASSVHGEVAPTKDPGLYAIWVQMTKGHAAAEAEALIMKEMAALAGRAVDDAELARAKNRLETELWRDLSSSHGRAELLGQFEVATGDFRRLFARAGEYARVTPEDIRRVAAGYLATGARSVVVARPKEGR